MSKPEMIDPAEVAKALELFMPAGEVTEIRMLEATVKGDRRQYSTVFGYFDSRDEALASLNTVNSAASIYFTLNAIQPDLLARAANRLRPAAKGEATSDSDVTSRRWLLVDADAKRLASISASDAEHDAAIARIADVVKFLAEEGWPAPVIADSGNGSHALYAIDLPADDGGLVQRCLAALASCFDDDQICIDTAVFNPARVCKLYGTLACKGDSIASRPHRMSKLLSVPATVGIVSRGKLEALAVHAPKEAQRQQPKQEANPYSFTVGDGSFDLDEFVARYLPDAVGPTPWKGEGRIWELPESPLCQHHDGQCFVAQQPSGAIVAGCHHNSCQGKWSWHTLRAKFQPKPELNGKASNGDLGKANAPRAAGDEPLIVFERLTSAELDAIEEDVVYLVDDVWPALQGGIVGGRFKTLKTSVAIDLAMSVAIGKPFIGRFNVQRPARVGIMSAESGRPTLKAIGRRVAASKGTTLAECADNLVWSSSSPKLARAGHLDALRRFIDNDGLEGLVIDPAYLSLCDIGNDASNVFKMGEALAPITELIQETGCSIILVHHHTKHRSRDLARFDPPDLAEVSMSGFMEWARFWCLLGPRREWDEETGRHWLYLRTGGSAGHAGLFHMDVTEGRRTDASGRRWAVDAFAASEGKEKDAETRKENKAKLQREAVDDRKAQIVETMKRMRLPETMTEIRKWSGIKHANFGQPFHLLQRDGAIIEIKFQKGKKVNETGWKFKPDEDD
jgi:hypothetical protein